MRCYANPYRQVSEAIRRTGDEVWTGAARINGLRAGTLQVADEFSMSGVFTFHHVWYGWLNETREDSREQVNCRFFQPPIKPPK